MDYSQGDKQIAFGSTQGVSLVSTIDGSLLGFWRLEGSDGMQNVSLSLAPGGKTLAAQVLFGSGSASGPDAILYIINTGVQ
jgi:hypothetical protein